MFQFIRSSVINPVGNHARSQEATVFCSTYPAEKVVTKVTQTSFSFPEFCILP